ncbi:hypothetical protein GTZ99_01090 [Novosphingobium sp. FSY-8]|uniref:Secreted protein with PEP-CTERM sorting signal n=1 Tax=Novosphingobium ovatum TaxID=1908523 RepID=A0ABW9X9E0_9SPHN|nr:hypothetical protein [Novosphingobium ovatum]NBC35149.1 hypothetical protein [Novosphingobium ovatum]
MRTFLNLSAGLLLSVMLAQPVLAQTGGPITGTSDLSLMALGLAGLMLGHIGGQSRKRIQPED